ncbi:MAG: transposase [Thermodesulfobacteriota bacterium]|nr:transposase [Thermodesulfobacteriota bacterium]
MPRQPRIDAPGILHHIICRGIERRPLFTEDDDREDFVTRLTTILTETSTLCYAWTLIPNHFHLLLRTGTTPISTVMQRLLTGYAVTFNRRHKRSGHLFQNRYKSIICQDDLYLLELIRYIHLNPLRAGLVPTLDELANFSDSGHRQLLGKIEAGLVAADEVLALFGKKQSAAQRKYAAFIADAEGQGKRPELVGGGLLRSLTGQGEQVGIGIDNQMSSDERILGDGDFVESILREAQEQLTTQQQYQAAGFDLEKLTNVVARLMEIEPSQVKAAGKQPIRVQARSLFCYWAVRDLGFTATALAKKIGISQPAVSQAVQRGEILAAKRGWVLPELINL